MQSESLVLSWTKCEAFFDKVIKLIFYTLMVFIKVLLKVEALSLV